MPVKQNVNVRCVLPVLFVAVLIGCSSPPSQTTPDASRPTPAPPDPWVITNLDPNVETSALLWNGLIGLRWSESVATPKDLVKSETIETKNESFDITAYSQSGEEKLQTLRPLMSAQAYVGEDRLLPDKGSNYKSELDPRTGLLKSHWIQQTRRGGRTEVTIETTLHPTERELAQRWTIAPEKLAGVFLRPGPDSLICDDIGLSAIPDQLKGIQASLIHAEDILAGKTAWHFRYFMELADANSSSPRRAFQIVGSTTVIKPHSNATDFNGTSTASEDYWAKAWLTDIEVDGPVEDQQFIRSALFYLRSAIHPEGKMSISPMGLSSDIYNGHVFWDADIWVFPALALIDPQRAKTIPEYRLHHLRQAKSNYVDWIVAGQPAGDGQLLGKIMSRTDLERMDLKVAVKFPWESSVSGKETVPGPSRFQDHITGSVAWSINQATALNLVKPGEAQSLREPIASFYQLRSSKNPDGLFEIKGTMSPDEHHTGDNDLYTNLLAMWVTNNGKWPAKPTHKLPADDNSFLTYDNDPVRGYKQAAAVLSIYPLQYPPAEKQARQMMERFADKVTKNGPAMTDSIHSIIWARLGEKDKAYKSWHDSWKPFVKPPFLLFSEKRNSSRTYFTTGAAGSLQAVLYGFAGIRIDSKKDPNAQWSIPLRNGQILSIAPNLPKEWKKLTLRNLTILGKKYTFEIAGDKVKVTEGG